MMEKELIITAELVGERLDKIDIGVARSALQRLIAEGGILVNGQMKNKSYRLEEGDSVVATFPEPKELEAVAQDLEVDIIYEDDDLLVVNKAQGMVVHPAAGNLDGTLVNALLHHCKGRLSSINGVIRPGIVHRIDKDTSGLLLVAKNDFAHTHLAEQIKEHSLKRCYQAIVYGRVKEYEGTIDAPIGRHKTDRKKMCITDRNAKNAVTHYKVIEYLNGYTFVECRLQTGRTHQIRVHMASIGHPIGGDVVYGPKNDKTGLGKQLLHAKEIGFIHPKTNEYMEFSAQAPKSFKNFIMKNGGNYTNG